MSVLRKTPYIEKVLAKLSSEQLEDLVTAINTNTGSDDLYSLVDKSKYLPVGEDVEMIEAVKLELEKGKTYTGFLVYVPDTSVGALKSHVCLFIAYHRFQDLALFDIDYETPAYTKVNEYCDINELRRVLKDIIGGGSGGEVTPEALAALMEGDTGVSVDLNEAETKVRVGLDLTGAEAGNALIVNSDADGVEWANWLIVEEVE